jgi:RNA polymerase sigma-70 factor (ECF subfamily)
MLPLSPEAEDALCRGARSEVAREREEAFTELFRQMRGPVFALCLHLTGQHSEAEDAVQECFMAVHQALASFRGEARVSTWVYRIAVRAALSVKARRRRRWSHAPLDDAAHAVAPGGGPEQQAATREEFLRLDAALASLSEDHRLVLALFAIDGLSHAQVAEVMGVPPGTVWSRLHHARKRLGEALETARGPDRR